jgi:hypothetical protein
MNIKRWLESEAYQQQKAVINGEANSLFAQKGKAPITNACPSRTMHVDYSVFEKSVEELGLLYTLKKSTVKKKLVTIGRYQF